MSYTKPVRVAGSNELLSAQSTYSYPQNWIGRAIYAGLIKQTIQHSLRISRCANYWKINSCLRNLSQIVHVQ